ncbi:MAG: hypothetical protein IT169_08295 [Bryobacterales bacterium]|nr:hypothetical protein [Bryobacterales bacterium]
MGGNAVPRSMARTASRWRTRACAGMLCAVLVAQPVLAQSGSGNPANPEPGQSAPTRLQIRVLTRTPLVEPAGALSANQVTVQVLDGWGMPVPGATISFRLPEAGPGGVFLNGLSTEVAIADREGKAAVRGFDWRPEPGTSFLHVIAAYGEVRAGAMVEVQLSRKVAASPPVAAPAGAAQTSAPASAPPSAFPLPEESRAVKVTAAPADATARRQAESRPAVGESPSAAVVEPAAARAVIPHPIAAAPRERIPAAPPADYQAPNTADTASYVTVKRKSGGGNRTMLLLVVAAAAAGGAVAAVVAGGGSAPGGGSNSGGAGPAGVTIGSPSITVTGGGQ